MLTFLSCIETGLLPRGRLDPPLWSQTSGAAASGGKRRRPFSTLEAAEETTKDYVFRIIDNSSHRHLERELHRPLHRSLLFDPHVSPSKRHCRPLLPVLFRLRFPSASARTSSASLCSSIFVVSFTGPFKCVPLHFRRVSIYYSSLSPTCRASSSRLSFPPSSFLLDNSHLPRPNITEQLFTSSSHSLSSSSFFQPLYEPLSPLCAPPSSRFHSPFFSNVFLFISTTCLHSLQPFLTLRISSFRSLVPSLSFLLVNSHLRLVRLSPSKHH